MPVREQKGIQQAEKFAMHIFDKGLIIRVHKELLQSRQTYQSTSKEAI